jgi:hypothetical protein
MNFIVPLVCTQKAHLLLDYELVVMGDVGENKPFISAGE